MADETPWTYATQTPATRVAAPRGPNEASARSGTGSSLTPASNLPTGQHATASTADGTPTRTTAKHDSFFRSIFRREVSRCYVSPAAILSDLACTNSSDKYQFGGGHSQVPPFCVRFCPSVSQGHTLAVADEEGVVSLFDTNRPSLAGLGGQPNLSAWQAHNNAIFDVAWVPSLGRILTASGDQTCRVWDIERSAELLICRGHTGSVKTLSSMSREPHLFSSGARDGSLICWDVRAGGRPVVHLKGVHSANKTGNPRKRCRTGEAQHKSVTSVLYLLDAQGTLATSGATDGAVKLWDSRLLTRKQAKSRGEPKPLAVIKPSAGDSRHHGITCLATDASGGRLLASSTDNSVYLYDCARPASGEIARFGGHLVDSFYVKAAFSPDGRFVLSGSSDSRVYLWEVGRPDAAPIVLRDHEGEVTGVDWCPSDICKVATCSDDARLNLWRVARGTRNSAAPASAPPSTQRAPCAEEAADSAHAEALTTPPPTVFAQARTQSVQRQTELSAYFVNTAVI